MSNPTTKRFGWVIILLIVIGFVTGEIRFVGDWSLLLPWNQR